jgi:CDGSH-type Zn-finger protein
MAAKSPPGEKLEKGKQYFWCRCGRSANQPFCDGSRKGTGIEPLAFEAKEDGEAWLRRCKATGDSPYCDGTHKSLSDLEIGDPVPEREGDAAPTAEATPEESHVARIHELARNGLNEKHGEMGAMGVPGRDLPRWGNSRYLY